MSAALETINIPNVRYDRVTDWQRSVTIPWDLAIVVGTLTSDLGPTLKAGQVIYSKHSTRQLWAELKARSL